MAIATSLSAALLLSPRTRAVDFSILFTDAPNTGFFDPVLGQERRDALYYAADIWGRLIRSAYEDETIHVHAQYDSYPPGSNTLASASPNFFYSDFDSSNPAYADDTNYPKALANHLNGGDLNAARHEINISVNNAQNFYYGVDGLPGPGQTDFVTVAAHEIGHGLGFYDSFRQDGDFGILGEGTYTDPCPGCLPTPYDRFLWLAPPGGAPLISLSDSGREAAMTSNNIFWNGPAGIQANGGTPPQIFAPSPWQQGSSIGHLDETTFQNELMSPTYSGVDHIPSAIERGMLRDMGWTISVASQQVTWTGAGGNNSASTAGNWSPALPFSDDNLMFDNPGAAGSDINMDLELGSVGEIRFGPSAPDYTLRFNPDTDLDVTGAGVVRESAGTQTILLESRPALFTSGIEVYDGSAAVMNFKNGSGAGNGTYELGGGATGLHSSPPLAPTFNRTLGASITFNSTSSTDSSSAETATFNLEGGIGNGAFGAQVAFKGTSTAGDAEFSVGPGRRGISLPFPNELAGWGATVRFESTASANTAHFRNYGLEFNGGTAGATEFFESGHAFQAVFDNYGSPMTGWTGVYPVPGGSTRFFDNSVAESGVFNNHPGLGQGVLGAGITFFYDDSTADHGTFNNLGGVPGMQYGGATEFHNRATAGNATFHNEVANGVTRNPLTAGNVRFYDDSTAGDATFHNKRGGGSTFFYDSSTAGDGHFFIEDTGAGFEGYVGFFGSSKGGTADFTINPLCFSCGVLFRDTSNAEQAEIKLEDSSQAGVQFWNGASMGNANIEIGYAGGLDVRDQATAANATIRIRPGGTGSFNGGLATAGDANITLDGGTVSGGGGGSLFFSGGNAGNATINVNGGTVPGAGGGQIHFGSGANAGTATVIAGSGVAGAGGGGINLGGGTIASNARFTVGAGGFVSLPSGGPIEVGSIEGAGTIQLGHNELRAGALNTSTTISGPIIGFATNPRLTKIGTGTLTLTGANTYIGLTTVDGGTLVINGSTPGSVQVNSGATLKGTGTIGGTVTVNSGGTFAPGTSPGTITVGGLVMTPDGTLDFELGDPTRDHIVISNNGNLSLAGTLNLSLIGGFTPALGQTFSLFEGSIGTISGTFSSIVAPIFDGHTLGVTYSASSALLEVVLAGDFNRDGNVDAADYVYWRKTGGPPADYTTWRTNFGRTLAAGAGSSSPFPLPPSDLDSAVPEPPAFALVLTAATLLKLLAQSRRSPKSPLKITAPRREYPGLRATGGSSVASTNASG
jgi:autotransporter-associated beta strand protein